MKYIPFVAYLKVIGNRANGKRFEYIRSLEALSSKIYEQINSNLYEGSSSDVNIAQPGGGVTRNTQLNEDEPKAASFSFLAPGLAITPDYGNFPAQLKVVGFYHSDDTLNQPHPRFQRIHAGQVVTGPIAGSPGWNSNYAPTTQNKNDVATLKSLLDNAIDETIEIIKIDLNGVLFGQGGYTFPS